MKRRLPTRLVSAIAATAGVLLAVFGLLTAFAGLPWWISVGAGSTAVVLCVRTYRLGRLPTAPLEILTLIALCGVLSLAARGAGDLIGGGHGPYRYFVTKPLVYSHIAPWSRAIVADALGEGQEFQVQCRTEGLRRRRQLWLRLEDGTYVEDAAAYQDYSSHEAPGDC